jgi:hypothetical protein
VLTANPFDTIKEVLPITDILLSYGVEVKKQNKAICPLHSEKSPSFTIYPKTNSWHCFGCGVGGSAIDFVMAYCGLDSLEAAKKLDMDFNLGLFDYKPTLEERHKLKEQQAQREAEKGLTKAFEGFINKAFDLLCDYLHLLHDWKITHAPKSLTEWDNVNALFVEACHQLDYIEHLTDFLLNADIDEQISFYQTHRKELLNIAKRIRQHKNSGEANKSA